MAKILQLFGDAVLAHTEFLHHLEDKRVSEVSLGELQAVHPHPSPCCSWGGAGEEALSGVGSEEW